MYILLAFISNLLQKTTDAKIKAKLTNLVRVAVERAEVLKAIKTTKDDSIVTSLANLPSIPETNLPDTTLPINPPATVPTTSKCIIKENVKGRTCN